MTHCKECVRRLDATIEGIRKREGEKRTDENSKEIRTEQNKRHESKGEERKRRRRGIEN